MANSEHLAILKRGKEEWRQWRAESPETAPDLRSADLVGCDLSGFSLTNADLGWADLRGANLNTTALDGAATR